MSGCSDPQSASLNKRAEDILELERNNTAVSAETWKDGRQLRCEPRSKQLCDRHGCEKGPPSVWAYITPSTGKYIRCEQPDGTCEDHEAEVSYSGLWATLTIPKGQAMLRLTSSGRYVEVLALGDQVVTYHGQCQRVD